MELRAWNIYPSRESEIHSGLVALMNITCNITRDVGLYILLILVICLGCCLWTVVVVESFLVLLGLLLYLRGKALARSCTGEARDVINVFGQVLRGAWSINMLTVRSGG